MCLGIGELKDRLGAALLRAGPNQGLVRPFAQQQPERPNDDGLPGAGFTGKHVETRRELDGRILHQGQVSHAKRLQHGGRIPGRKAKSSVFGFSVRPAAPRRRRPR